MDAMVCYCFGYRRSDLLKDLEEHEGCSTILGKINAAKQRGECQCLSRHPEAR